MSEVKAPSTDRGSEAYADLSAAISEIEMNYVSSDRNMNSIEERTAGRYLIANALQHGFQCWFDIDPQRPLFHRWLSATKKLLGDNPDFSKPPRSPLLEGPP